MNDGDIIRGPMDCSDIRYWKKLIVDYPDAGESVQHDPNSPFEELRHQNTTLHLVVMGFYSIKEEKEVVTLLLESGISPNIQNDRGETPLHIVCQTTMRDPEIAKLLLKYGADQEIRTSDGKRPIDFLAGSTDRYSEEIRSLLEKQ